MDAGLPPSAADGLEPLHKVSGRLRHGHWPPAQLVGACLRVLERGREEVRVDALAGAEGLVRHRGPDPVQPAAQVLPACVHIPGSPGIAAGSLQSQQDCHV